MSGITYILLGLMMILLTHYKPPAYWNNNSRTFLRKYIGDRATALLHELIGIGLIIMGIKPIFDFNFIRLAIGVLK